MYNTEKPILYGLFKLSVGRWILEVFGLCIINPNLNIQLIQCSPF